MLLSYRERLFILLVSYWHALSRFAIYFFAGDIQKLAKPNTLMEEAYHAPDRKAQLRLGPVFYPYHLSHVLPSTDPTTAHRQLRTLMALEEPNARCAYTVIRLATRSNFILNMHSEAANPYRKRFVRFLNRAKLLENAEAGFQFLTRQLAWAHRKYTQRYTHQMVSEHARSLLFTAITGFTIYPESIYEALNKLHSLDAYNLLPEAIIKRLPPFKKLAAEIEKKFNDFLTSQMRLLRAEGDDRGMFQQSTYVVEIIRERFPQLTSFKLMTDEMIKQLSDDPELRLGVTSVFAFDLLNKTFECAIEKVFGLGMPGFSPCQGFRDEIDRLTKEGIIIDSTCFMNKEKMPMLHAVYLEILRYKKPFEILPRYTSQGIRTDELQVPPRTLVTFDMKEMMFQCFPVQDVTAYSDANAFSPERFLLNGKLLDDAVLNQGHLAPFGVGSRACPAASMMEALVKFYLVRLYQVADTINCHEFTLKETHKPKLNGLIFNLTENKNSLFFVPKQPPQDETLKRDEKLLTPGQGRLG